MTVPAANGENYYLVDVIAQILKYLKGELLKSLTMAGHPLKVTDFDWVVTVPAIWKALQGQADDERSGIQGEDLNDHLYFMGSNYVQVA